MITLDQALTDKKLLGAALGPIESWATWSAVLRAAFGQPLNKNDRKLFRSVAGDRKPPKDRVSELWAVAGRRSGKSRMAAAVATYIATFIDHRNRLAPGETGYVLSLSPSVAQAQLVFQYALAFLQSSPILKGKIESITRTEIRLRGNIVIAVHPNSFRTVRGRTLLAAIFDESAYWRDETSASPDVEVYRAVLPSLATTAGMLVGISSPYRRTGLLFAKHRDHYGKDGDVLVVQAASRTLNPTLSEAVIARAKATDPEGSVAEWEGNFREDLSGLLSDALIDAAIDLSRPLELPRRSGNQYHAFLDSSGGRHDHYTLCIAHREDEETNGKFVADLITGRKPPFDPHVVTQEFVGIAKAYGCNQITGDAYSGEWLAKSVEEAGARYVTADLPKSALYLEALPLFSRNAVNLPNHPILVRELRLLERRVHRSGKDSVDHPSGGSDDYANAVVGAMRASTVDNLAYDETLNWVSGGDEDEPERDEIGVSSAYWRRYQTHMMRQQQ